MNEKNITNIRPGGYHSLILTVVLIIAKVWGDAPISWCFCLAPVIMTWVVATIITFVLIWLQINDVL